MDDCPLIDKNLINWLNKVFPLRAPEPGTPLDQIMYDAGRRRLIDQLSEIQKIQEADHVLS